MSVTYQIISALLAAAFLLAGGLKLVRSKQQLRNLGMKWVDNFSTTSVRLIGIAEVCGALGLVLPLWSGIAPILSPLAAAALTLVMAGATYIQQRLREPIVPSSVLLVASLVACVLGFAGGAN